jgi:hypothetical protein
MLDVMPCAVRKQDNLSFALGEENDTSYPVLWPWGSLGQGQAGPDSQWEEGEAGPSICEVRTHINRSAHNSKSVMHGCMQYPDALEAESDWPFLKINDDGSHPSLQHTRSETDALRYACNCVLNAAVLSSYSPVVLLWPYCQLSSGSPSHSITSPALSESWPASLAR